MKINSDLIIDGINKTLKDIPFEDRYSINEIKTNKFWLDGKPIYRKVLDTGSITANQEKGISTGLAKGTIDNIIRIDGFIKVGFGTIPTGFTNSGFQTCVYYNSTSNIASIISQTNANSGYIILEYTKTTD